MSYGLAVLVFLVAIQTGVLFTQAPAGGIYQYGWSFSGLTENGVPLWTMLTGLLVPASAFEAIVFIISTLVILTAIERRIGSIRLLIALVTTGIGATAVTFALQWMGSNISELWLTSTVDQIVLDPFAMGIGAVMTATAFLSLLWRRRLRLFILLILVTYVLYSGDVISIMRGAAALIGLALGSLLSGRLPTRPLGHPSRHETRTLVPLLVIVTAIGPLIATTQAVSVGPLSAVAYIFYDSDTWGATLFSFLPLALVPIAFGIRTGKHIWLWLAVILELLLAFAATYTYLLAPLFSEGSTSLTNTPADLVAWFVASALIPAATAIILIASRFRIWQPRPISAPSQPSDRQRYRQLLRRQGQSFGHMGTWPGMAYWFTSDGGAAVAYRLIDGVAIVVSDPVGSTTQRQEIIAGFIHFCEQHRWLPVFYSIHVATATLLANSDWHKLIVAHEAVLNPATFTLEGGRQQNLRTARNRAQRDGITAKWCTWDELSFGLRQRIVALSDQWIAEKKLPEMSFTLGSVDELRDPTVRIMLTVDREGRIHAVTSWLPVYRDDEVVGWTLDFMRKDEAAMPGIIDFTITEVLLRAKRNGLKTISLAASPLARVPGADTEPSLLNGLLTLLSASLEPIYGFQSLTIFKRKYHPRYDALYLCYQDPLSAGRIARAVAKAYLPGMTLAQILRTLRSGKSSSSK